MSGLKTVHVGAKSAAPAAAAAAASQQLALHSAATAGALTTDWLLAPEDLPNVIVLESADHVRYPLPRSLAFRMGAVQKRIANGEGVPDDDVEEVDADEAPPAATASGSSASAPALRLRFPDLNSTAMQKVIEFVMYEWKEGDVSMLTTRSPAEFSPENQQLQLAREKEAENAFNASAEAFRADPNLLVALSCLDGTAVELLPRPTESIYSFLRTADTTVLCELASASFYLDVKSLVEATCRAIAGLIRGKTAEEIRLTFSITNDFTPEEEEAVGRSIVERAAYLPADVLDGEHGAQALLSAPIPRAQPLITAPVRVSQRTKLRNKLLMGSKQPAQVAEPASLPPLETPSVDELMAFIERGTADKKRKAKKGANKATTPAPPPAAVATSSPPLTAASAAPSASASFGPSVPAATVADSAPLLDESIAGAGTSAAGKKKKKKKKAAAKKKAADEADAEDEANPDAPSSPPSPSLLSASFAAAAASAFRNYSSSALSALMNDPQALAGLLANHRDTDPSSSEQFAALADLHATALGPSAASFSSSLNSILHRAHVLESMENQYLEHGRARSRISAEIEEYASDDDSHAATTRTISNASSASQVSTDSQHASQSEVEFYQSMLASVAPLRSSSSPSADLPPNVVSNIAMFTGAPPSATTAASAAQRTRATSTTADDDAALFFRPDSHLSRIIDAKLTGLANWEANGGAASPIEFDLNTRALDSFAPYMCLCHAKTAAAAAAAALPSSASDAASASCPSSPSLLPASTPVSSGDTGLSHMTLCAHCGLFQHKSASMDDSQLNLASPSKGAANTSASVTPNQTPSRKTKKSAAAPATPSAAAPSPTAASSSIIAPTVATPAAAPQPPASVTKTSPPAAVAATPAAAAPASSCQNHGNGACSCCATLTSLLPKLAELQTLQHRVSSMENSQKQAAKSLAERLRCLEKYEAQLKALQTSLTKQGSEERAARQKLEETMRRDAETKQRAHDAAMEEMRALLASSTSASAQSAANAANETKQRLQRCSDRLGALEKSALARNEETDRETKRTAQKLEKLVAQTVAKELAAAKPVPAPAPPKDDERYTAMLRRMEQGLAAMELARTQQQQQQAQAIGAAVTAALNKRAPSAIASAPHSIQLPSHYTSASSMLRSQPSNGSSLHSVFSSGGGGSTTIGSTWQSPAQPTPQHSQHDLYPFDSSDSVAASLLADDTTVPTHPSSSYFSMFAPPIAPPSSTASQHGAIGSRPMNSYPGQSRLNSLLGQHDQ